MEHKKGYPLPDGYMGYKPDEGKYRLFATEQDYNEWFDDYYEEKEDGDENT